MTQEATQDDNTMEHGFVFDSEDKSEEVDDKNVEDIIIQQVEVDIEDI